MLNLQFFEVKNFSDKITVSWLIVFKKNEW